MRATFATSMWSTPCINGSSRRRVRPDRCESRWRGSQPPSCARRGRDWGFGREARRAAADWQILGEVGHESPIERVGEEDYQPPFLQELVEGLDGLGAWGLDRRLRTCLRHLQRIDSQLGALLSIVAKARIHRRLEIESAARYAEEHLGFSKRKAQMLLRIERAVQVSPVLARAYRRGEIS